MAQTLLVFTLLYFAFSRAATPNDTDAKKVVTVKRLAHCMGRQNLTVQLKDVIISYEKPYQAIQLKLAVNKEIEKNFLIKVTIRKCDASGSPDACEYLRRDHEILNVCTGLKQSNSIFKPYLENFDGPKECPIKKGEYTLRKTPITESIFVYAPMMDNLWKLQFNGYDGGNNVLCIDLEVAVKIMQDTARPVAKKSGKK